MSTSPVTNVLVYVADQKKDSSVTRFGKRTQEWLKDCSFNDCVRKTTFVFSIILAILAFSLFLVGSSKTNDPQETRKFFFGASVTMLVTTICFITILCRCLDRDDEDLAQRRYYEMKRSGPWASTV